MARGRAMMPRDSGNAPIPVMSVDKVRKLAVTSTASVATALPTTSDGSNPRVVTLYADTGAVVVTFGASDMSVAADFSTNVATGVVVPAGTFMDVPVVPGDNGQQATHFSAVTASFPSTQTNATLLIMARS
jgi:hypothetical protein